MNHTLLPLAALKTDHKVKLGFIYSSVYMPIPAFQFIPHPPDPLITINSFYICDFISVL